MEPEDKIVPVGCETQLLIDDYVVDDLWRIRRSAELPDKHLNNPVFTGAPPFEDFGATRSVSDRGSSGSVAALARSFCSRP